MSKTLPNQNPQYIYDHNKVLKLSQPFKLSINVLTYTYITFIFNKDRGTN